MRRTANRSVNDGVYAGKPRAKMAAESTCPICLHDYLPKQMSKHHLVPKSRKGKETRLLCRNCHHQIHALFTEKELERHYGTLETLLAAADMQPWIRWVRKRKPAGRLRMRRSRRRAR